MHRAHMAQDVFFLSTGSSLSLAQFDAPLSHVGLRFKWRRVVRGLWLIWTLPVQKFNLWQLVGYHMSPAQGPFPDTVPHHNASELCLLCGACKTN